MTPDARAASAAGDVSFNHLLIFSSSSPFSLLPLYSFPSSLFCGVAVGVWRRPPDIAHTEKLDGGGFVFILLLLLQNGEISAGLLLSSISLLSSPTCLLWFPVFSFHNFSHQTYYVCHIFEAGIANKQTSWPAGHGGLHFVLCRTC